MGVGLVGGAALFIGGCLIAEVWWAVFAFLPALLGLVCQYGITSTLDPSMTAGWFSLDSWVFLLAICLTSTFGLPVMLAHVNGYPDGALACYICAGVLILGGFCLFSFLSRDKSNIA
jgi:hypothetical protein